MSTTRIVIYALLVSILLVAAISILALVPATSASSPGWTPPISISTTAMISERPSIAAGPDGKVYVAWRQGTTGNHHVLLKIWDGVKWQAPMDMGAGIIGDTGLAVDSNNVLYVVFLNRENKPVYRILGDTLSPVAEMAPNAGLMSGGLPKVQLDPASGTPHVVWDGYTSSTVHHIYYAYLDGSWQVENTNISGPGQIDLAVSSLGIPHLAFTNSDGRIYHVSRNSASNWNPRTQVSPSAASRAQIAFDSQDTVHITYYSSADSATYYRSQTPGANWTGPDQITTCGSGQLAVDLLDNLHHLFECGYEIYYKDKPAGQDWTDGLINVSRSPGSNIRSAWGDLALDPGGRYFATWRENVVSTGAMEIYFAQGPWQMAGNSITGVVQDNTGNGIQGVRVQLAPGMNQLTSSDGTFSFINLPDSRTFQIAVSKEGHVFTPERQSVTTMSGEQIASNFIGQASNVGDETGFYFDLPVAYDGSQQTFIRLLNDTDNKYKDEATGTETRGLINSWFDHNLPFYTVFTNDAGAPKGDMQLYVGEPITGKVTNNDLKCYGRRCYDGHNGYDFVGSLNEPIYPVAPGKVIATCTSCVTGYGNYVILDHQNGYYTRYGHLNTVSVSPAQTVGQSDSIGGMGSTGNSGGVHLHLSVYRDDGNGIWDCSSGAEHSCPDMPVDPYGWLNSRPDPWVTLGKGPVSRWLWKFPYPEVRQALPGYVGGEIRDPGGDFWAAIDPGCFSGPFTARVAPLPASTTEGNLRSTGHTYQLSMLEGPSETCQSAVPSAGNDRQDASPGIAIIMHYDEEQLSHLDEDSLSLVQWNPENSQWDALVGTLDTSDNQVTGSTSEFGVFDLQAPLICPEDATEPNDTPYSSATADTTPTLFDIPTDEDWYTISATQGATYLIQITPTAAGVTTNLELYASDANTLLASDTEPTAAAEVILQATTSGVYYLRVTQDVASVSGCNATYDLAVTNLSPDLSAVSATTVSTILNWNHITLNNAYELWRGVQPYFQPGDAGSQSIATFDPPFDADPQSFSDTSATTGDTYYYILRASNPYADAYSNRAGIFSFTITVP